MSRAQHPLFELLKRDPRFRPEAYEFVREALSYVRDILGMSGEAEEEEAQFEQHLTGQQLCEAIRLFGLDQFGLMTQVVLKNWGVTKTGDFGDIVYNLIEIGMMKKSPSDQRKDFDDVYQFDDAFREQFRIETEEKP